MVLATTLIKLGLRQFWGVDSALLLYYSAVLASAYFGGALPGFLATLLSAIAAFWLFVPNPSFLVIQEPYIWRFLMFLFDCTVLTLLCSALRNARNRVADALTETQKAQRISERSGLRFRRVFESNMIGLIFTRKDGQIFAANSYFLNMLGFTQDDVAKNKLNWKRLTSPETMPITLERLDSLEKMGTLPAFEKSYFKQDGSRVPVLLGSARLEDDSFVTFVLDITEQKRVQAALEESALKLEERVAQRTQELRQTAERLEQSQKFLDSVIENLPNMVFVKDAEHLRFVRFNKAGEDLLGYSRADLIGKSDHDFFPFTEAEFFQKKDRAVLEGTEAVDIVEEPLSTRHGLRYLHTKKIPIRGADGKPLYLLGISEDITAKKAAEHQHLLLMQEQAARLEAEKTSTQLRFLSEASGALNESLDLKAMLEAFAKCVISHMSDWCEIVLIAEGELKIEDVVIMHRDPEKMAIAQEYRQAYGIALDQPGSVGRVIRTGRPELHQSVSQTMIDETVKDPNRHRIVSQLGIKSAIIVPLLSYGRILGSFTCVSSESNRAYNSLDLSIVLDLAKRAALAIENSRLFTKAQEASQAKSAFLANMSHEIRTPLGAMLGFAELLSDDGTLKLNQRKYVSTLIRNGNQLMRIVDQILDISKVESDLVQVEYVKFSLRALIEDVMTLLRHQAENKSLEFHVSALDELPEYIISDPTRLRQILINLVGNAIKFTLNGSIDVHIELHANSAHAEKPVLEISVIDTGIGVTRDQRDKLFQPFVQADNSMTRRFGGTGLGLFLARRLARLMGGDVVLGSSHPLKGSQFIITLAVDIPGTSTSEKVKNPNSHETIALERVKGRVLVVDDAADNRTLMQLYLSRFGLEADTAASGIEGVDLALNNEYRLIFMDIQMPEMDGFAAVQELRAHNYHGPIIALTAHNMKGDRERCLEGGFDDYLGKPIDRNLLKQSLIKFVNPEL